MTAKRPAAQAGEGVMLSAGIGFTPQRDAMALCHPQKSAIHT
jgi:hypothetical protein